MENYIRKGWQIIPIPKGSKAPVLRDWTKLNITEEDIHQYFSNGENVGVKLGSPSNWLVDIDLDCEEAIQAAPYFLPATGAVFGRSSKPYSHYLYYCNDSVTTKYQFKDMICELRSTGAQTVFPPSIHPSGDKYIWNKEGDPATVSFNLLKQALAKLASCVLLAWNYPENGVRQDAILPLTGWLYRAGWSKEEIETFITALCDIAQDEEVKQRVAQVKNTIDKVDKNLPATGYPKLREYYPEEVLRKVGEWLDIRPEKTYIDEEYEPQKDYGHALVLSKLFNNKFRWVMEWGKWIEYNGKVWNTTSEERVAKEASECLHTYYTQELNCARDKNKITELTQKIKEVWSYSRITGALNFLKGFPNIMTSSKDLDNKPYVLNLENGTLDLETLTIQPHKPEDLLTKMVKAKWNTGAKIDEWQKHLDTFLPNKNIQREIQRELGLALTGVSLDEVLPIWYGTGANGKSTTLKVIMEVMGDYSQMAAPRLLIKSKNERHTTELAELQGRRLVFSTETGENGELDEEKMKWLTGGERLRARFMRQDNFEFPKSWIIFLVTNYKPVISGTDEGTWRRIRLVPWEETLPVEKRKPQEEVVRNLLAERDGILQWLVAGLKDWKQDHHWVAEEVLLATEAYREEEDILRGFIKQRCELKAGYSVEVGALYSEYEDWCIENGEEPKSKLEFSKLLKKRGLQQKRTGHDRTRKWIGIRIHYTDEDNAWLSEAYNEDALDDMRTDADRFSVSPIENLNFPAYTEMLSASGLPNQPTCEVETTPIEPTTSVEEEHNTTCEVEAAPTTRVEHSGEVEQTTTSEMRTSADRFSVSPIENLNFPAYTEMLSASVRSSLISTMLSDINNPT